jgi:hypothetical protein
MSIDGGGTDTERKRERGLERKNRGETSETAGEVRKRTEDRRRKER